MGVEPRGAEVGLNAARARVVGHAVVGAQVVDRALRVDARDADAHVEGVVRVVRVLRGRAVVPHRLRLREPRHRLSGRDGEDRLVLGTHEPRRRHVRQDLHARQRSKRCVEARHRDREVRVERTAAHVEVVERLHAVGGRDVVRDELLPAVGDADEGADGENDSGEQCEGAMDHLDSLTSRLVWEASTRAARQAFDSLE